MAPARATAHGGQRRRLDGRTYVALGPNAHEGVREGARVLEAVELREGGRDIALRGHFARIGGGLRQVHQERLRCGVGAEGHPSGEELEEHDPHRIEVAAAVERVAASVLGAHVFRRPAHDPRLGQRPPARRGRVALQELREPEVDHLHAVEPRPQGLEDDVVRLEVAVNDSEGVRLFQRRERLSQDVYDASQRQWPLLVGDPTEVAAAEVLHHDVRVPVRGSTEVEDGDRVGVAKPACRPGFVEEARRGQLVVSEVGVYDLDRHGPPEGDLFGAVHPAHAPHADQVGDAVAPRQSGPDERVAPVALRGLSELPAAREAETVSRLAGSGAAGAKEHWATGKLTRGRPRRKASRRAGA